MTDYKLMNTIRDGLTIKPIETIKYHGTIDIKLIVTRVEDKEGNLVENLKKPRVVSFPFGESWQVAKVVNEERARMVLTGLIYHRLDGILKAGYFDYGLMRYHMRGVADDN